MARAAHDRAALLAVLARLAGADSLSEFQRKENAEALLDLGPNPGGAWLAGTLASATARGLRLAAPRLEGAASDFPPTATATIQFLCSGLITCLQVSYEDAAAQPAVAKAVQSSGAHRRRPACTITHPCAAAAALAILRPPFEYHA